jgi:hypothetical protein
MNCWKELPERLPELGADSSSLLLSVFMYSS